MKYRLIILLFVFVSISIADDHSSQAVIDSIVMFGNSFGDSKVQFEKKIGIKCHYASKPIENKYNNSIDTIYSTSVNNINFEFYSITLKKKVFLKSISIVQKPIKSSLPIWPSMKREEVEKILGIGSKDKFSDKIVYSKSGADWNGDLFWLTYNKNNILIEIYWNFET